MGGGGVKYCDPRVCMLVCMYVCLRHVATGSLGVLTTTDASQQNNTGPLGGPITTTKYYLSSVSRLT